MIRKRILLVSLLKPVTDTRFYEKIGRSLAQLPTAEVHVAGFAGIPLPTHTAFDITFHPVFTFKRLSRARITAQGRYWKLLQDIAPDLLIVGTHELLLLSWLYCKRHPCKLVYDVQENYFLNLTTQQVYPGFVGRTIGHTIRGLEKALAPTIDHFFLAEESYAQELPFLASRYTILQNKYLPPPSFEFSRRKVPVLLNSTSPLRLLYSGTISKLYGVLEAIQFTQQLRLWVPSAELTIIGYCADARFLQELKHIIEPLQFVKLIGGNALVPHEKILEQEQTHHIGLLPYHPHPSTFSCVPTKLYEYLGIGLVVIMEENQLWNEILMRTTGGISISFARKLSFEVVEILLNKAYYQQGIPEEVFWNEESAAVRSVTKELLDM